MPAHILVVDDDAQQRADLAEIVRSLGYEVTTAADGGEALSKLASVPVSAILTDLEGGLIAQGLSPTRRPDTCCGPFRFWQHRPGDFICP
jgi:CheY-like chemotaxis protein